MALEFFGYGCTPADRLVSLPWRIVARPSSMIAEKGSNSRGAPPPKLAARFTRLPRLSRYNRRPFTSYRSKMLLQGGAGVLIQPVDVDLAMAVTNVHQDRAVGKALDLCRTRHPIEPGGGDNDARSPNGIVEVGHAAALMPPTGVIMFASLPRGSRS